MLTKLKKRIIQSLEKADTCILKINAVADLARAILESGVSFRLKIAGKEIPIELIMEPDDANTPGDSEQDQHPVAKFTFKDV